MAMIQGIRIRNFKSLKDITLGNVCDGSNTQPLTPITAVIGKNGVGKTSLFDVFGFLADCMKYGVAEACDVRGGFERVVSQGQGEMIELMLCYRPNTSSFPVTFDLKIAKDKSGQPYIKQELLYVILNENPIPLLAVDEGSGLIWGENTDTKVDTRLGTQGADTGLGSARENTTLRANDYINVPFAVNMSGKDKQQLATATFARLSSYPYLSALRDFVEGWYLSYFTPDAARNVNQQGTQPHLNSKGDNLSNVVEFMMDKHPERFQAVLERIASKIPGIGKISTYRDSVTRNLYLMFEGKGFAKPFTQSQMSDGTLKLFTYLLLLEDPEPAPLLCIEEPENGLYHQLLETLAQEIREHTSKGSSQVFITTHQPYFVDALEPEEVWILEKGEDGFSTIRRASDDPLIQNMVEEGLPLGGLWYSGYLDRG